jgi:hypothetical protein
MPTVIVVVLWLEAAAVICMVAFPYWRRYRQRLKEKRTHPDMEFDRAVQMPTAYVKRGKRFLKDVPDLETVVINFTDITVDPKGRTFVDLDAEVLREHTLVTVSVRMEREGCILTMAANPKWRTLQFRTGELLKAIKTYTPVIQIIEEKADE